MREPTCASCCEPYPLDQLIEFEGDYYCSSCLGNETVICTRCGERIWNSDNSGSDSVPLCERCYEDYYTSCTSCGRIICTEDAYYEGYEDDDPYCRECHRERDDRSIHDYYYKPAPIFYGDGKRYFGVELEVDEGGEYDDSADSAVYAANTGGERRIYCKHDGSLDEGFEIVTHPMTLDYHTKEMPWDRLLEKLKTMGYSSHKAGTCGLHIHVNRTSLGDTDAEREATVARILYLFEKFWDELLKFSRRTHRQLERWAARYGYKESPRDVLDHAKKGTHNGRYTCVNLENTDTIEFRMFRGTLKLNTVIATLQLVDRVCDVALYLSDEEVKRLSWTTFVSGCSAPELVQYLKERRLYINEPVECEEDI